MPLNDEQIRAGTITAYLTLKDEGFFDELARAMTAVQKFEDEANGAGQGLTNFIKAGDNIASFGDSLTRNVTLPLSRFAKSAVSDLRNTESAFVGVTKTIDEERLGDYFASAAEGYDVLSDAIWQMTQETSSSYEEIARVMEWAGQLGVPLGEGGKEIIDFTKTMVMLGDTTNLSSEQAAEALAKFMNITNTSFEESENLGSAIVHLGNNFATTELDIVNMATRMASAGTIAGLSEQEILALATAISSVGIRAEAGGSAMAQTFTKIEQIVQGTAENAEEKLNAISRAAGMSAEEFAYVWENEPIKAVTAFIGGLENMEEEGGSSIVLLDELGMSGIRQSNMLKALALSSDNVTKALEYSNNGWKENSALTEEAEKRYATLDSRISRLNERWKEMKVQIAEMLLPVLEKLLDFARKLIDGWMSLDDSTKKVITTLALVVAAVGPVLSIGGRLISGIGRLVAGIGTAIDWLVRAGTSFTSTGTAVSTLGGQLSTASGAAATAATSFGTFAGQALKLAAVAVVILAAAAAVKILTDAAIQLYNAGPGAIATFAGLTAAGILMTAAIAAIGSACTATAPGLLALGAAVLMVSSGIALVTAAIALLVKAFADLVRAIADLVTAFVPLADKMPLIAEYGLKAAEGILAFGAAALVASPSIVGLDIALAALIVTTGIASTTVGLLTIAMTAFSVVLAALTLEVKTFGEVFVGTFNAMSLAIEQITGVIITSVENLVNTIINLFNRLKYELIGDPIVFDITNGISNAFSEAVKAVIDFISDLVESVVKFFSDLLVKVKDSLENILREIKSWFGDILKELSDWYEEIKTGVVDMFGKVKEKIDNFWNELKQFASGIPEKFFNFGKNIFDNLLKGLQSVWGSISTWASEKFEWITNLVRKVGDAARDLFNISRGASSAVGGVMGSYASGLDYVPFDGYIAELHKGERVLTKQENISYNNGMNSGGDTFNFYNVKSDPYEYAREMKRVKRELAF